MTESNWPFIDPPNVAVFTDRRIVELGTWIYCVSHDRDDGAWQFHGPDGFADEENARVVALRTIFELDDSIGLLADLPLGWCAWRESVASHWQRAPQHAR
jgi:hypothetical protein